MKLRLLLTEKCNRDCEGCCNKQWNLDTLPICMDYTGYECIMLTGGEPMLFPKLVKQVIRDIRKQTDCPIYLYTAKVDNIITFFDMVYRVDGFTVTLHEQSDVEPWFYIQQLLSFCSKPLSLRLNVFKGVDLKGTWTDGWIVKDNIEWIENCPLPDNEMFMRYNNEDKKITGKREGIPSS